MAELKADSRIANSKQWKAEGKSGAELLIVDALGLDAADERSNYLAIIKAANELSITDTEEGFVNWIKENHGIVALVRKIREDKTRFVTTKDVKAWVEHRLIVYGYEGSTKYFELPVEPDPEAPAKALILIAAAANGGKLQLVESITKPGSVRKGLEGLIRLVDAEENEEAKDKEIAKHLRTLNRAVLQTAGIDKRKPGARWQDKVSGAAEKLYKLKRDAFDAEPKVEFTSEDPETSQLKVQNVDCDALDLARYLANAKAMMLIPYPFEPEQHEKNRNAAKEYLRSKAGKEKEGERTISEVPTTSGATLSEWL